MRSRFFLVGAAGLFCLQIIASDIAAQTDPWDMVKRMGRGTNIGNTLDAPTEGRWASPVQEFYFDDYKDAGFKTIRIPVRWENHMQTSPPYTVDPLWLDRVEQIVDWSLDRGLITIINSHHDRWLYSNFPDSLDRFEKLWEQIAHRFKDKPDELLFEIINEPYFDLSKAEVDTINHRVLNIIRVENPHRITILTGGGQNSYDAVPNIDLPVDPWLMAYFHYYKPFRFTHDLIGTWGSPSDKALTDQHFDIVKQWSESNNVPILLGEFGVGVAADPPSSKSWYSHVTSRAIELGFSFTVWCSGPTANIFTYYRQPKTWNQEQLNLITQQTPYPDTLITLPGTLEAENFDGGDRGVSWWDSDSSNSTGAYRNDAGVEIDSLAVEEFAVYLDNPDEWVEYSFSTPEAGNYRVITSVAATESDRSFELQFNAGFGTGIVSTTPTGSPAVFVQQVDTLYLDAGFQVVRLETATGGIHVDKIEFEKIETGGSSTNLLKNAGFESGIFNWVNRNCTLENVNSPTYSGASAVKVSDRTAAWSGPAQNITDKVVQAGQGVYKVSGFLRSVTDDGVRAKLTFRISDANGNHYPGASGEINTTTWSEVSGKVTLDWSGTPGEISFYAETLDGYTGDFYIDDVTVTLDSIFTGIRGVESQPIPKSFDLANFPNPFNPSTGISFSLSKPGLVQLRIYDLLGRQIRVLKDEVLKAGSHIVQWDGRAENGGTISSGIYVAKISSGGQVETRKLMLMK